MKGRINPGSATLPLRVAYRFFGTTVLLKWKGCSTAAPQNHYCRRPFPPTLYSLKCGTYPFTNTYMGLHFKNKREKRPIHLQVVVFEGSFFEFACCLVLLFSQVMWTGERWEGKEGGCQVCIMIMAVESYPLKRTTKRENKRESVCVWKCGLTWPIEIWHLWW